MTNRVLTVLLMFILIVAGCKKQVTKECIKARIVRVTCASTVIQAIDNDSLGEDGWLDITTNRTYDNVFNAANSCRIPSEYKTGDVIYITLGKATGSDCVHCAWYDAAPKTSYDINSIENIACEEAVK